MHRFVLVARLLMADHNYIMQSNARSKPAPPARQGDEEMLETIACQHAVSLPAQSGEAANWPAEKQSEAEASSPLAAQVVKPDERAEVSEDEVAELSGPDVAIKTSTELWLGLGVQILILLGLLGLAWLAHLFIKI
jgi:hypothetical protein